MTVTFHWKGFKTSTVCCLSKFSLNVWRHQILKPDNVPDWWSTHCPTGSGCLWTGIRIHWWMRRQAFQCHTYLGRNMMGWIIIVWNWIATHHIVIGHLGLTVNWMCNSGQGFVGSSTGLGPGPSWTMDIITWPGIDGIFNRLWSGSIGARSVGFPKSVTTSDQGDRLPVVGVITIETTLVTFFNHIHHSHCLTYKDRPVIHVHPGKGVSDVRNTEFWFRVAQRPRRVDVDQSHRAG